MLTLKDGRTELWQWDTGREVAVSEDCSQVHFGNKIQGRSIDVDVVDGVAKIPDVLLQTDGLLNVWAFIGTAENGYTKVSRIFVVNKRNRPADYVFTPTEQTSLGEILERLDDLESMQAPDAIKNAVEDYLEQNPIESPVQSVNGYTGNVKLTAEDVGAISQENLQEATNEALAQAKESGAFDGAPGEPGKDGQDGKAFIVTITESGGERTADKIPSEIYAAHNRGVPVLASLMEDGGIVIAYLVVATEDAAMFQVPNFMLGEEHMGVTVIIAGNDPADRSVSVVETAGGGGTVKTVNGVGPDENGNVEITIPDSGGNVAQGLTAEQISALDGMFKVCAFTKADVSAQYNAFKTAFGIEDSGEEDPDVPVIPPDEPDEPDIPEITLTSISATYSGGDVAVGTAVADLTGIVVTAHYSDGSTENVTGYTLSGEIAEGSNTVTVSYGGKTATITVTGVAESGGDEGGEENPVEPVYALASPLTTDGSSLVDTGYVLGDEDKDWTVVSDVSGNPGYGVASWCCGGKLGLWSTSEWSWRVGFSTFNTGGVSVQTGKVTNLKTVVTHKKGEETLTVYHISDSTFTSTVDSTNTYTNWRSKSGANTVTLGGQIDTDNRYWTGTLNDFKIYERVLTEDEIKAYMGVA